MDFLTAQQYQLIILLAFAAISFKYDHRRKCVKSSKIISIYSKVFAIILRAPFWYMGKLYIEEFDNILDNTSNVSSMVYFMEVIWLEIGLCLVFLNGIIFRKSQEKLLNLLLKVERDCLILKIPFNQEKCLKRLSQITKILSACSLFSCIFLIILQSYLGRSLSLLAALFYFLLCNHMLNKLLSFLLIIVKMQRKLFQSINKNFEVTVQNGFSSNELRNLLDVHNKLSKTIQLFTKSFGRACAAFSLYVVALQTCDMYLGPFTTLSVEITTRSIWIAVLNILWISPIYIVFVILGFECKRTQDEAHKRSFILERVMLEGMDKSLKGLVRVL